ncbi:MAG: type II toxin-antitoxin system RelE/ParE family toxin [Nitrospinae bacterium]|nr:type II toxin-antitoxin system RelE/ParE family toxin [Nitrospinota bacterium]
MAYKVSWNKGVGKDLNQIPISTQKRIIEKVETLLANDPLNQGRALVGKYRGLFRYRVGDYRIIYTINELAMEIRICFVGHRKDIYR